MRDHGMIDGNMIALRRHEREIEQYEAENEKRIEFIEWVIGLVDDIRETIDDYDEESLKDMSDKLDKAMELLEDLIGKLEGER